MKPDRKNRCMLLPEKIPIEIAAAIFAMSVAVLRVVYDKKETRVSRVLLESVLCGALSLMFTSAIIAMSLDSNWAIFAGGAIGYAGSTTVRALALKFVDRKIG